MKYLTRQWLELTITEAGLFICLTVPDLAIRSEMPPHSLITLPPVLCTHVGFKKGILAV